MPNHVLRRLAEAQLVLGPAGGSLEAEAEHAAKRTTRPRPRRCACGRPAGADGRCGACARAAPGKGVGGRGAAPAGSPDLGRSGRPLDGALRMLMEQRLGGDFAGVRVHTGTEAAEAAGELRARAFTAGREIVFGDGQYAPGTVAGQRLLAHELTHVRQQEGAPASIQRQPAGGAATAAAGAATASAGTASGAGPCEVVVGELSNRELVAQIDSARGFLDTHEKGNDYYDYANLMRRLHDERMRRGRAGHVWLLQDPPAAPGTLYELQQGGGGLEVMVVPADVEAALGATGGAGSSLITPSQLDRFLERQGIPTVDAASWFAGQQREGQEPPEPLRFLLPERAAPPPMFDWGQPPADAGPLLNPWLAPGMTTGVAGGSLYTSPFDLASRAHVANPVLTPGTNQASRQSVSGARVGWRGNLPETATGRGTVGSSLLYRDLNALQPNFEVFDWRQRMSGRLVSVTNTMPGSGAWTPGGTAPQSTPGATPAWAGYHDKFRDAMGMLPLRAATYATSLNRLNTAYGTSMTPIDAAANAYLAINSDHVDGFRAALERQVRAKPGDYANMLDAFLRERPGRISRPGGAAVEIGSWNDLQVARANSTITVLEFNAEVARLAQSARARVISNGMTTVEIARLEAFRLQTQGLPPAEFARRFPPEYMEAIRAGGAAPAAWGAGKRGAATSALLTGAVDLGRMAWQGDASPEAWAHLGIDVGTSAGGGFVGSAAESGVGTATTRALAQSSGGLATAGRLAGRGLAGGVGGGIAAPLVTIAAMGLDPYHTYTPIDYVARSTRAFVSGAAGGAGGALAAAGTGFLAGTEVPIAGNIVGFFAGLAVYYIVDGIAGDSIEQAIRLEMGEGGCTDRGAAAAPVPEHFHGCFPATTPVRVADGSERPIASLVPGDELLGYDDRHGEFRTVRVTALEAYEQRSCIELVLDGERRALRVTPEHPLHAGDLWLPAGAIRAGARLTCLDGARSVAAAQVTAVAHPSERGEVFNLSVSGCHTYFAGDVLVHNKNI